MSDTPRTDHECNYLLGDKTTEKWGRIVEFARSLERELALVSNERDKFERQRADWKAAHDGLVERGSARVVGCREALEAIAQFGHDTLSGPMDRAVDRGQWWLEGVQEMTRRARAALAGTPSEERKQDAFGAAVALLAGTRCPDRNCDNKGSISFYGAGGVLERESCQWCEARAEIVAASQHPVPASTSPGPRRECARADGCNKVYLCSVEGCCMARTIPDQPSNVAQHG